MGFAEPFTSLSCPRTDSLAASLSSSHRITLGLPELCPNGMSENWVLRNCGAIHWARLADALGVPPEQVFDKCGERLYASFFRVNVEGPLTEFAEGEQVELDCELKRISPLRYKSEHIIRNASRSNFLRISMCSTFVKRRALNDNVHLIFSEPVKSAHCVAKSDCAEARLCHETAKQARQSDPTNIFTYDPSPIIDFNAAGLFYFAQYQAALDSAEWQMHRLPALLNCGTMHRTISYFGNLNVGDKLKIAFSNVELSEPAISHVAAVYRESDNFLVAEAVTRKQRKLSCDSPACN
jgi:probable biosynthetic protein (TIGR04099 family)